MVLAFDGQHVHDVLLAAELVLQLLAIDLDEALVVLTLWHLVYLLLLLWLLQLLSIEVMSGWALS